MLKTLFIASLILVLAAGTLSLLGQNSEYIAERLMHKATVNYSVVISNPDVVPPGMIEHTKDSLKYIIEKFPESRVAKLAHLKLIGVYFGNRQYDEMLLLTDTILKRYNDDAVLSSKAQFSKAAVYETKGEWSRAEQELKVLGDKYANTPLGLRAPYYIAAYYNKKGNQKEVERALNEALVFYGNLKEQYAGSSLGYEASTKLMETYLNLKQYEDAGEAIKELIKEYPGSSTVLKHLAYIDLIFLQRLQAPDEAIEIYQHGIEHAGNDKIREYFQKKIELIREKGQKVSNSKS